MRHIVLIGFMGSGKTETGKRLAQEMRIPFLDVDKKITSEMRMSVADIFGSVKYFSGHWRPKQSKSWDRKSREW